MKFIDIAKPNELPTPIENITIIDVRTPSEHARAHIPSSINVPLDRLKKFDASKWRNKTLLFHCKSGNRTRQAEALIDSIPCQRSFCLKGGIEAWKKSGKETISNAKAPLELMRQVQIIAGIIILIGIVLAYLISPYFIIITAVAGLGLLTAGITGFCGMANLLMLLPYNKSNH